MIAAMSGITLQSSCPENFYGNAGINNCYNPQYVYLNRQEMLLDEKA
jgi:hypothetical protein